MTQMMHLVIATVLFQLTWHLVLQKTWPMKEKINDILEKL